jgi:hypothetical protein
MKMMIFFFLRKWWFMKKWLFATLGCFVLSQGFSLPAPTLPKMNQVIYYQHAKNAVLSNNTKGLYELTMVGIDDKTLAYESDFKCAETIATEKFFNAWGQYGFIKNPPQVAIIDISKGKSLSFSLKEPRFNLVKKTVSYTVEPLQEIDVSLIGPNWNGIIILFQQVGGLSSD